MPQETSCKGEKADGSPCGALPRFVDPETGYCAAHDPDNREALREAARKGGQATARKLKRKGLDEDELPPLTSPQAAETWLETVARAVAVGRLGHHEGKAVIKAIREWIRVREAGEQAERLEELAEKLEAAKGKLEVVK